MADQVKIIQVPTKGQPVDSSLLSDMATAINALIGMVDQRKGRTYVQPDSTESKNTNKATANASFFASTAKLTPTSETVSVDTKLSQNVNFKIAFDGPPVVTATITTLGEDVDIPSATVIVSKITKASCTVTVKFTSPGKVKDIYVHVIAVGSVV